MTGPLALAMTATTRRAFGALAFVLVAGFWLAVLAVHIVGGLVAGLVVMLAALAARPEIVLAGVALALVWRIIVVSLGGA